MRTHRLPFVLALGALLALGLVAGNASAHNTPPAPVSAPSGVDASGVWFCPGLPAQLHVADRVTLTNFGESAAAVTVSDLTDAGKPTHRSFAVAPLSVVTKTRDELGPPGALTIETFGGHIVVEEGVDGPRALDSAPCATQTAPRAYFAAGTTVRGVAQWLVIDNPYASDAKVDVMLRTNSGPLRPDRLQALDISRRSRLVLAIDTFSVRDARVAVEVDARVGSFVAAQTLMFTKDAPPPGVVETLGVTGASDHWTIAGDGVTARAPAWVAITNVGGEDAPVDVQALTDANNIVPPVAFTLAADDVTWVQLGNCGPSAVRNCVAVPAGTPYALDVRSEQGVAIVAQTLSKYSVAGTAVGVASAIGTVDPHVTWAFARSHVSSERSTTLTVFNPGASAASIEIDLVHDGQRDRFETWRAIEVPPGQRVTTVVAGRGPLRVDAGILVLASQPVFVERSIVGLDEVSRSAGVVFG